MLDRRTFIGGVMGGFFAVPLAARAQDARTRRIGILMGIAENDPEGQARVAAFRQGLQDLKWVEGRNIRIDLRWGTGDATRVKAHAAELVSLAPNVILATNTPTVRALQQATRAIPMVFAGLADPVGDGAVTSLSKPGGNITGFSSFDAAIAGKWLQLLKEISPNIVRVAVIFNPDTAPHSIFMPALEAAASSVALKLIRATVRDTAAIENAIATLGREPGGGLVVMPDVFVTGHRELVIAVAARNRVAAVYPFRFWVAQGGLLAYGPDIVDQYRRVATYIDRILQGAKPADLPVQAPTKFELAINLRTAKAVGLTIPQSLLVRATEVIE